MCYTYVKFSWQSGISLSQFPLSSSYSPSYRTPPCTLLLGQLLPNHNNYIRIKIMEARVVFKKVSNLNLNPELYDSAVQTFKSYHTISMRWKAQVCLRRGVRASGPSQERTGESGACDLEGVVPKGCPQDSWNSLTLTVLKLSLQRHGGLLPSRSSAPYLTSYSRHHRRGDQGGEREQYLYTCPVIHPETLADNDFWWPHTGFFSIRQRGVNFGNWVYMCYFL